MQPLSDTTAACVTAAFPEGDVAEARALLEAKVGNNLVGLERVDAVGLERVRAAAIKVSGGTIDGLRRVAAAAEVDWRVLLVEAGFGLDLRAHERWWPPARA